MKGLVLAMKKAKNKEKLSGTVKLLITIFTFLTALLNFIGLILNRNQIVKALGDEKNMEIVKISEKETKLLK